MRNAHQIETTSSSTIKRLISIARKAGSKMISEESATNLLLCNVNIEIGDAAYVSRIESEYEGEALLISAEINESAFDATVTLQLFVTRRTLTATLVEGRPLLCQAAGLQDLLDQEERLCAAIYAHERRIGA